MKFHKSILPALVKTSPVIIFDFILFSIIYMFEVWYLLIIVFIILFFIYGLFF
jgi:hypothetical protein